MAPATDVLGVLLFRDEMLAEIWPEQKKHVAYKTPPPEYNCTFTLAAAPRVANPSQCIDAHVEPPRWKVSTIIWQGSYQASLT